MLTLWNIQYPPAYGSERRSPLGFIDAGSVVYRTEEATYIRTSRQHQYAAVDRRVM